MVSLVSVGLKLGWVTRKVGRMVGLDELSWLWLGNILHFCLLWSSGAGEKLDGFVGLGGFEAWVR